MTERGDELVVALTSRMRDGCSGKRRRHAAAWAPTELRLLGESPRSRVTCAWVSRAWSSLACWQAIPASPSSALPPETRGFFNLGNLAGNLVVDSLSAARDLITLSQRGEEEGKTAAGRSAASLPAPPSAAPGTGEAAPVARCLRGTLAPSLPPSLAVPLPAGSSHGAARPFWSQTVESRLW